MPQNERIGLPIELPYCCAYLRITVDNRYNVIADLG